MDRLHDPVELYQSVLKEAHAHNASAFFEDLVRASSIDIDANAATTKEIYRLDGVIGEAGGSATRWKILRIVVIVAAGVSFIMAYGNRMTTLQCLAWSVLGIGLVSTVYFFINGKVREFNDRSNRLKAERSEKVQLAWSQMLPLNQLFGWDAFPKILKKTFPLIELDAFFSQGRLSQLKESFGFDESFNVSRSVVFPHSGVLNGNPFVLAQSLDHWMGTKTYRGSLRISWTTLEKDSLGRLARVRHNETLRASVNKPFPEYIVRSTLIYGNKTAADLSFSREPNSLSDAGDGLIDRWRKSRALKKLTAKSRILDDDSEFTLMSNHDFETLFNASDRNHEVQFRVLFTPLAQQMMVKLLRDKSAGYGDAFSFYKDGMINKIAPEYLIDTDISAKPSLFHFYDVEETRKRFNDYHNELFKSFFFTFAPLLLISVYQERKSEMSVTTSPEEQTTCFWEHEAIANHMGEESFAHPESITRNVLKTEHSIDPDGAKVVEVTAHGFAGENRVDYVQVRGGDGNYHDVEVPWVEYIPVERTSHILVCDPPAQGSRSSTAVTDWRTSFEARGIPHDAAVHWRSVVAASF
jgi:hypothetical protein